MYLSYFILIRLKITIPYGAWFHKDQWVGCWATEYGNLLDLCDCMGCCSYGA
ncbi:unnamed protein product, partial [Vitis vinifera]|uniref:Uncharacterized protein n=1 Tax=Vitis vinifera TaxID=29760 RepID=E0CQN8_VITVI